MASYNWLKISYGGGTNQIFVASVFVGIITGIPLLFWVSMVKHHGPQQVIIMITKMGISFIANPSIHIRSSSSSSCNQVCYISTSSSSSSSSFCPPPRLPVIRRPRSSSRHYQITNSASSSSQPKQQDPKGINGTGMFYAALVAAQLLPFSDLTNGLAGDLAYFSITALSCIVIGVRRAPLEPPSLSAPLSKTQVITAPFAASAFLFGSYLLLKYTSIDLNLILNLLTVFGGSLCLKESLDPVYHSLFSFFNINNPELFSKQKDINDDEKDGDEDEDIPFLKSDVLSIITTVMVISCYLFKIEPTFVFSNIIAVSLATRILSLIKPSSFLVACGLLVGLFFYDIYWVFGSEVMVSVATTIDTPGKLLFPRILNSSTSTASAYPYAILGLGDICVPGIFLSITQALDMKFSNNKKSPYFTTGAIAYVSALFSCFWVNFKTGAAQPALLYLVPALIISTLGVGVFRNEFKQVISFADEDEEDGESGDGEVKGETS